MVERVSRAVNAMVSADEVGYAILKAIADHEHEDFGFNRQAFKFKAVAHESLYPRGSQREPDGFGVPELRAVKGSLWLQPPDSGARPIRFDALTDEQARELEAIGGAWEWTASACGFAGYDLQDEGLILVPPPESTGGVVTGRGIVALELPVAEWSGTVWEFIRNGQRLAADEAASPWFDFGAASNLIEPFACHLVHAEILGNDTASQRAMTVYAQRRAGREDSRNRRKAAARIPSIYS